MPSTNSGTPKPLYQSARSTGAARKRRIISSCTASKAPTPAACSGCPQSTNSAITATCGSAIAQHATCAARCDPRRTGSEPMPMRVSPPIDLKSLSVMMPCAPAL